MMQFRKNYPALVAIPYCAQAAFSILHLAWQFFSRFNLTGSLIGGSIRSLIRGSMRGSMRGLTRIGLMSLFLCSTFLQIESHAHGDEDHGAAPPPIPTQGTAARFSVNSDELELVAVYAARHLTIYLDHFADNTPITGAKLEIEGAGVQAIAKEIEAGVYVIDLPQLTAATYPFTISVEAGDIADLLAASLNISANEGSDAGDGAGGHGSFLDGKSWALAGGGLLMLAIATVSALLILRRRQSTIFKLGDKHHG